MERTVAKVVLILIATTVAYLPYQKLSSIRESKKTIGKITQIYGTDDRCHRGGKHGASYYDCTRFYAKVEYTDSQNQPKVGDMYLGYETNHHANYTLKYKVADQIKILYNEKTQEVAKDQFMYTYGSSIIIGILLLFVLLLIFKLDSWNVSKIAILKRKD